MQQQSYAYESKFQKFYLIRIIQLFQEKTLKMGFREIKLYANKQTNEKEIEILKGSQQVFDGETYISTKEYSKIFETLPKIKIIIDLSEHLKKKLESNSRLKLGSVKDTQSFIQQNEHKQQQEIITQRAINKFLSMKSIRCIGQNQINKPPQVKQKTLKKINQQFTIKLLLVLFIISSIYIMFNCYFE
ncbi:unnamed protein product [Paramecium sonneborni]|uniref:Transmembrane protein n=1 Tax=Paramecium sonneborni TaxID=65129 RepID=A0A8S1MDI2_9CILI|nr:unnamed protein product [Paramecium sonneborni]